MDRDQQRQNKRNTVSGFSCTAGAELNPLQNPAGRTGAACDPTPAAPLPFTPVTPAPCPAPLPVALNLPDGLIVPSDATTAYCPSTAGYSVTGTTASPVATGAQNQTVLFTAISNITENQLNYLYQVVPSSSAAIIAAALSGSTSSVIDLTHLNYAQAEELIASVQDAKFVVNTLAVEQARNLLICQAENNLQVASCPTSAYFGPSAGVPTGMMYVPSATSTTGAVLVTFALSPTSGNQAAFAALNIPSLTAAVAQANLLALAQAESSLRCVFGNAATAAACCTSQAPSNNLGYTAACVPATGPTIPGIASAVGYFSVPENTVFSVVSKNEANSVARELSRNSLNCYFPSAGVTATCVGLGLTAPFAPASTTSVYLQPGAVILYDTFSSVTAANAQASLIAQASLNCFWSNAGQTAFCPASPGFTAINNQYYILAASPTASIHYSSSVAPNTVISYISQADANAQALQLASANLSCVYCNNPIPPTCSGGVNATIGAAGDLICNVLAEVAQNTAISLGNILVSTSNGGANCCYGNEGVTNTIQCGPDAYYAPGSAFTSADVFYIPPNVITICSEDPAPPTPPLLFPYSNLYATNVAQVGCCSDILLCDGVTGFATPLPTLWATATDLFNVIATGATFYTDDDGATPYEFPAGSLYVASRAGSRAYRAVTGGTGYTLGLTACTPCEGLYSYQFRGATLGNYVSASAAYTDIFCGGPSAQTITLYTDSTSPFVTGTGTSPVNWYLDTCGSSAFTPVSSSAASNYYYAGYISGSTGYMVVFTQEAGNTSTFNGAYSLNSCPASRYAYSVYIGATACLTGGATTLYGNLPSPQLFTSSTGTTKFYTQFFNDASVYSYPSGTGKINFVHNTTTYYRSIAGTTAQPPAICSPLYPVTVQWSSTGPADVCNMPNYYDPNNDGVFNNNIRTLWCDVANPFVSSATAIFYTANLPIEQNVFQTGSYDIYLSAFKPGDTYRNNYREYTLANYNSALKSYTGAFKASPFVTAPLWAHSATGNYISTLDPGVPNTKFLLNNTGCDYVNPLFSDIKIAIPRSTSTAPGVVIPTIKSSLKTLPVNPAAGDLYSNYLLFDGVGYELSASAGGTSTQNTITLNDLSKVGAGFTGAIVRCAQVNRLGYQIPGEGTAIPTYISSYDTTSGAITLGGYYNTVNTTFSNEALYVTGFKIEAGNWSSSQFTCYGDHCSKLEVGHSLFSYYVGGSGVNFSVGYVTKVVGNTVHYSVGPSYSDFASFDIGTGASHGSGHVYIQGRQFARLWEDDNKTQPFNYDLQTNTYNYIWSQLNADQSILVDYTVAKNLVLGNTAGSTAEFIVAGVNYAKATTPPRPYSYNTAISFNYDLDAYYYNNTLYECNGVYNSSTVLIPYTKHGVISTCCDIISPTGGGTAVSACNYFDTYGYDVIDDSSYIAFCDSLDGVNLWYDHSGKTILDNVYRIVEGQGGAMNLFSSVYFNEGQIVGNYPCSSKHSQLYPLNTTWMRAYMGYYDPSDPSVPPIYDCTVPGTGCVELNNSIYWGNQPGGPLSYGYVFKEYVPDDTATTGCNDNNFIPKVLGLTSGYSYTIWSTTGAAWSDVNQLGQIAIDCTDSFCANTPGIPFNASTTGCAFVAPASFAAVPQIIQTLDESLNLINSSPAVVGFNPSSYDAPNMFNFGSMPSVGGTAESLKAEATQIAQNIVNSFVRCYYFNDQQIGGLCPNPLDYLLQLGVSNAGEVISNISKEDANSRAQDLANSRTICISPDVIGGAGCASTEINNTTAASNIGDITLDFNKSGCVFTPSMSFNSNIVFSTATIRKITVCSSTGANIEMYIPDMSSAYPEDSTFEMAVANPL